MTAGLGPRASALGWGLRRPMAVVALILGSLAVFAGSPYSKPKDVSATELATWVKDRKPGLRVVDLRPKAEFVDYHIPGAEHATVEGLTVHDGETVVLVADARNAERAASVLGSRAYVLRGGFDAWREEIANPKKPTPISRYFGAARRGGC